MELSSSDLLTYETLSKELKSYSPEHATELLRDLARNDLFWMLWYMLGRKDAAKPWILERCREIQADPDEHLDLWSREHYKSTIITFAKTIQDLMVDPNRTFGIFSHTRPQAKDFLRQIKREFEGNRVLRGAFPDIIWENPQRDAPKWSEDEGIILKRTSNPREASVEAWGVVDGQPVGKHYWGLIYDDIVTAETVTTPEMLAKTRDMMALSYSLGSVGGVRRCIGTRYHFNDAYRTLMDRKTFKPRIRLATHDGTMDGELAIWDRQTLQHKRRDMGPYTFSCQIWQNPVADDVMGFKREWLLFYDQLPADIREGLNVYLLVDAASSKKKGSDYTVIWAIGLAGDNNAYVLDLVRDRLNLTERAEKIMALHRKWKPLAVRYEVYGMQGDVEHIQHVQKTERYRFHIDVVSGQTPKNDRIRRLMPWYEQGRFYFPKNLIYRDYEGIARDLVSEFIDDEFAAFPVGIHDDMLDSQARLLEPDLPLTWPRGAATEQPRDRYAPKPDNPYQRLSAWAR
jgi:predicted phage terminase large subunit-like protein